MFAQKQIKFDQYFIDQTLRIDYYHTGDSEIEIFSIDKMYKQGIWAGNPNQCLQPFDRGAYYVKVYDKTTKELIFTKGYNSIFGEYQTIGLAKSGIKRTYHESILMPYPKNPVLLVIEKRDRNNLLHPIFDIKIDPSDYHIITETFTRKNDEIIEIEKNGHPHEKVDLIIIGDGYTVQEKEKFKTDLKYYADLFFKTEPYKSYQKSFNLTGIFTPSEESGTDEPRQHRFKNTALNSSFNIFETDRYCLAEDNKSIRDVAAQVPYDSIMIMVNLDRYGGGGIFNCQTVFNTGSKWRDYVFLHEFGHAFAGLADEYFTKAVAYEDSFPDGIEPIEPNITALLDKNNVKWKEYLSPEIEIPTEWGKERFEKLYEIANKLTDKKAEKFEALHKAQASEDELKKLDFDYDEKIEEANDAINQFINNHPLKDKVGVFEGANYQSKGLYRPTLCSIMHRFMDKDETFGKINQQALIEVIEYYTK